MRAMLLISILLVGCAGQFETPSDETDFVLSPPDYEAKIHRWFRYKLKDYGSAKLEFGQPIRGYGSESLLRGGGIAWAGYYVTVNVNGKNSWGAYTGFKPYYFLFDSDDIFRVFEHDDPRVQRLHRYPSAK